MLGGKVCRSHGGAAPQVTAKAQRRLQQAVDALVQRLVGMALDGDVQDHVALQAIRDALDRAGLGAKQAVSVEVKLQPYLPRGPQPAYTRGIRLSRTHVPRRTSGADGGTRRSPRTGQPRLTNLRYRTHDVVHQQLTTRTHTPTRRTPEHCQRAMRTYPTRWHAVVFETENRDSGKSSVSRHSPVVPLRWTQPPTGVLTTLVRGV